MTPLWWFLFVLLFGIVVSRRLSRGPWRRATVAEAHGMRVVWESYLAATDAAEGTAAAALVSPATLADMERIRDLALHAAPAALRQEEVLVQVRVLLVRAVLAGEALAAMDGRQLFAALVDAGWTNLRAAGHDLRQFQRDGVRGRAMYVSAQHGGGGWIGFEPAGASWRLDLAELTQRAARAYAAVARRSKLAADVFVRTLAGETIGRPLDETIWSPLRGS